VKAQGAGHVPFKTGNADPHIGWITQVLQKNRNEPDYCAGYNYPNTTGKNISHI